MEWFAEPPASIQLYSSECMGSTRPGYYTSTNTALAAVRYRSAVAPVAPRPVVTERARNAHTDSKD